MSTTWVTFAFEAANFAVLAAVLGWVFFRPVRDALERRRCELETQRRAAQDAHTEAQKVLKEARARRAALEESLEVLREAARREAQEERERVVEAARAQTGHERETLKEELLSHRRTQTHSLAKDAAFAARELVVRLLEKVHGPDLEESLLGSACRELEKLRCVGSLAPVIIESASELQAGALARLAEAAGVALSDAQHHINADLVAGVRVVTGKGLVDASVGGLAAQAERSIVTRIEREHANDG